MYEYSHGGNAAFEPDAVGLLDLSANINPLGLPPGVTEAVLAAMADSQHYPDSASSKLNRGIAAFDQVDQQWVFSANGASDVIFRLPRAVQAERVLISAPTFSDYERAALSSGARVLRHTLQQHDGFDYTPALLDAVKRASHDIVFLCNPNNPTGRVADTGLIGELLELCRRQDCLLAIDECFMDFTTDAATSSARRFLADYPNLIIIKAFTKTFAMPGIRLGYALSSSPSLIEGLRFHGPDWPVSNLAQAAGLAALADATDYIRRSVSYIAQQRSILEQGLSSLGYQVYPSQANYVFIHSPYGFDLREALDAYGIRIRSCANYQGLDDSYYRIAVSTSENNARLLAALQAVSQDAGSGSGGTDA